MRTGLITVTFEHVVDHVGVQSDDLFTTDDYVAGCSTRYYYTEYRGIAVGYRLGYRP